MVNQSVWTYIVKSKPQLVSKRVHSSTRRAFLRVPYIDILDVIHRNLGSLCERARMTGLYVVWMRRRHQFRLGPPQYSHLRHDSRPLSCSRPLRHLRGMLIAFCCAYCTSVSFLCYQMCQPAVVPNVTT